jgi:hypothetical protein
MQLGSLVDILETCAEGIGLCQLERLTARLERRVGISMPSEPPPSTSGPSSEAALAALELLVVRMEVAVS